MNGILPFHANQTHGYTSPSSPTQSQVEENMTQKVAVARPVVVWSGDGANANNGGQVRFPSLTLTYNTWTRIRIRGSDEGLRH